MSRWFRMYDCVLDDPKVQRLDPVLFKTWVNLLCLASRNDGDLPGLEDIAFALRVDEATAASRIADLIEKGLLDKAGDDVTPHNWDKRQFKSDDSSERVKRFREKNKGRDCNADVTAPYTETDSEQNKYKNRAQEELAGRIADTLLSMTDPLPDDAKACHDAVEAAFVNAGFRVEREVDVTNGDGVTGRFDLVVHFLEEAAAIEIDMRQARAKSVQKLLGFDGLRVQILRGSMPIHRIPGIHIYHSLPIDTDGNQAFERCWEFYPRRVSKGAARRAFKTALEKTSSETIHAAVKRFAAQCAGKETEFIPHMATWLNAERWQDEDLRLKTHEIVNTTSKVYVQYGTDAGDAWAAKYKAEGKVPPRDGKGGWWFPSEYPPQEKAA